jgi:hypothetical protein
MAILKRLNLSENALQNEFAEYIAFSNSAELKRFRELDEWFRSGEHQK